MIRKNNGEKKTIKIVERNKSKILFIMVNITIDFLFDKTICFYKAV